VISANGAKMTIIVVAGLDPATHPLSKKHLMQIDGCAGQACV
jgi:hypothetical protein